MADALIYFRFEGDEATPTAELQVHRQCLERKTQSLLSILASEVWSTDPQAGTSSSTPIVTRPLNACPETWSPEIVSMIKSAYQDQEITLPPNVELEEAIHVLDYYGLAQSNLQDIHLDEDMDLPVKIRARLFLRNLEAFNSAMEHCLIKLEAEPKKETKFIFIRSEHSLGYINEANEGPFVYPGHNVGRNFEWAKNESLRTKAVEFFQEKGFCASFHIRHTSVDGPRADNEYDNREGRAERLWVLTVAVPDAEPPNKRRRPQQG